jgi:hypothetical protein
MLKFVDEIVHKFLWAITEMFPNRTRDISVGGEKYLRRFYLTPRRLDEHGEETNFYLGFGVYLHYFYRGDEDRELHNHPWCDALSFILTGGYHEERRNNETKAIDLHNVRRYTFNRISHTDFHRVSKRENTKRIWTLFMTGKRSQDWGFWDREKDAYVPHADFVKQEDQGYKARVDSTII